MYKLSQMQKLNVLRGGIIWRKISLSWHHAMSIQILTACERSKAPETTAATRWWQQLKQDRREGTSHAIPEHRHILFQSRKTSWQGRGQSNIRIVSRTPGTGPRGHHTKSQADFPAGRPDIWMVFMGFKEGFEKHTKILPGIAITDGLLIQKDTPAWTCQWTTTSWIATGASHGTDLDASGTTDCHDRPVFWVRTTSTL